jgi:hypothetical protein
MNCYISAILSGMVKALLSVEIADHCLYVEGNIFFKKYNISSL